MSTWGKGVLSAANPTNSAGPLMSTLVPSSFCAFSRWKTKYATCLSR